MSEREQIAANFSERNWISAGERESGERERLEKLEKERNCMDPSSSPLAGAGAGAGAGGKKNRQKEKGKGKSLLQSN